MLGRKDGRGCLKLFGGAAQRSSQVARVCWGAKTKRGLRGRKREDLDITELEAEGAFERRFNCFEKARVSINWSVGSKGGLGSLQQRMRTK